MVFSSFPRNVAECGRLLLAREATTGYRTLPIAPDTILSHHFGRGGGYVVSFDGRPLVTFLGDGRISITRNMRPGMKVSGRINALLPRPYRIERDTTARHIAYCLLRHDRVVARFVSSTTFTPETFPELAAVA